LVNQKTFLIIPGVLKFDIPLQGIGAKSENLKCAIIPFGKPEKTKHFCFRIRTYVKN
jgi:hypothetical protein